MVRKLYAVGVILGTLYLMATYESELFLDNQDKYKVLGLLGLVALVVGLVILKFFKNLFD